MEPKARIYIRPNHRYHMNIQCVLSTRLKVIIGNQGTPYSVSAATSALFQLHRHRYRSLERSHFQASAVRADGPILFDFVWASSLVGWVM